MATALWNNASYQELLAELGLAGADVIEARQFANPRFSTMFPVGVKQLEFTLYVPLEVLWLRPKRMAAAELHAEETTCRLVQDGLDLVRDVRVAYADLVLAQERLRGAEEGERVRGRIAELARARVRAGSASELDAQAAVIDDLIQKEQSARLQHEVVLAGQRLRHLLGIGLSQIPVDQVLPPAVDGLEPDAEALLDEALTSRPDLCAARWACQAARERAELARRDVFRLSAMLPDANGQGKKGFEAGPGLDFTVPIFNQNQGAIARADAELEKARRHYLTVRDQAALEIRQASTRYLQAREALRTWDERIVPEAEEAVSQAEKAYQGGGASLLLVLETSRQLLDSRMQRAQAAADLCRALAELERSVGRRLLEPSDAELPAPEEMP